MNEYLNLLSQYGFPVMLVIYYLFIERPRQAKKDEANDVRYDELLQRVFESETKITEVITNNTHSFQLLTEKLNMIINRHDVVR